MKKKPSDYIKRNGQIYERIHTKTVQVDLDLDDDVVRELKKFKEKGFVSPQEYLRHILREFHGSINTNKNTAPSTKKRNRIQNRKV